MGNENLFVFKDYNALVRLFLFLLSLLVSSQAVAHEPYYSQVEKFEKIKGEAFAIKLLNGDGILGADPVRAIVVDARSRVRAVSPLATTLYISCKLHREAHSCSVYESISSLVYEPDENAWEIGPVIEKDGRPALAPEYMDRDYGFTERPAEILDIIQFEGDKIRRFPLFAVLSLIWWTSFALLSTPILWLIYLTKGDLRKWSARSIAWSILRLVGTAGFLFIAIFAWWFEPYSLYYAGFFAAVGFFLALFITRPRQREFA